MDNNRASITAIMCGYTRAYHATHDSPRIFDDFIAAQFYTPEEIGFFNHAMAGLLNVFDPETAATVSDETEALRLVMQVHNSSIILGRARFTEDCLEGYISRGLTQYVILGAGMDTFSLRRPELAGQLEIFEVDHPATQANKRERLLKISPELPRNLHLVPVNFEKDDLKTALLQAGFDSSRPAFFSWLGVTYYLERQAIEDTLQTIASLSSPGSALVFDYSHEDVYKPEKGNRRTKATQEITRQTGEPLKTGFDPAKLEVLLRQYGFQTRENLPPEEIEKRYFSHRDDLYHAFENAYFIHTVIE